MDDLFRKYGAKYSIPWALLKAQGMVESALNPNAESQKGAIGIMQVMPDTFKDIKKRLPHLKDIRDPESNIEAGAFYLAWLIQEIKKLNPHPKDIVPLSLAAYNWGIGNIIKIIKKTGKASWLSIFEHIPNETKNYVKKVIFLFLKYNGRNL